MDKIVTTWGNMSDWLGRTLFTSLLGREQDGTWGLGLEQGEEWILNGERRRRL